MLGISWANWRLRYVPFVSLVHNWKPDYVEQLFSLFYWQDYLGRTVNADKAPLTRRTLINAQAVLPVLHDRGSLAWHCNCENMELLTAGGQFQSFHMLQNWLRQVHPPKTRGHMQGTVAATAFGAIHPCISELWSPRSWICGIATRSSTKTLQRRLHVQWSSFIWSSNESIYFVWIKCYLHNLIKRDQPISINYASCICIPCAMPQCILICLEVFTRLCKRKTAWCFSEIERISHVI